MSKTLSNILVVFKVARILAKVAFILCIVGAACSLLGCLALPVAYEFATEMMEAEGLDIFSAYSVFISSIFATAGSAVFSFLAERYFKKVLSVGTPFTFEGAKECFRLAITSLIISASVSVVGGIVFGVTRMLAESAVLESEINMSVSVSTGLFFLFMSMIFKHGAELKKAAEEKDTQEEQLFL